MWITRKISSVIKHKSSTVALNPFLKQKEQHIAFVLGVTSGLVDSSKSMLIQCLELNEIHDDTHIVNNNNKGKLYCLKNNERFVIQIIDFANTPSQTCLNRLDGSIVCYDVANRDSMDALPDILNVLTSQMVPCLLIGLQTNSALQRVVDPHLGFLIANVFGIQSIEVENLTKAGAQLLQQHFIKFIYSDRKMLLKAQQKGMDQSQLNNNHRNSDACALDIPSFSDGSSSSSNSSSSNENVRSSKVNALTTDASVQMITTTATVELHSATKIGCPSFPLAMHSISNDLESDSVEAIIDRLLTESDDTNSIMVFLTVFRKFMRPFELTKLMIQRFELDLVNQGYHFHLKTTDAEFLLPTCRQERIRSFFCIWLSQYWGDFKDSATRRMIVEFLERISHYDELLPIYDVLTPLAIREPAPRDKDIHWGIRDKEVVVSNEAEDVCNKSRKKDSGYSDSFGWMGQGLAPPAIAPSSPSEETLYNNSLLVKTPKFSLKRAASTNSHHRIPETLKSIVTFTAHQMDNRLYKRNSTPATLLVPPKKRRSHQTVNLSAIFAGNAISVVHDQSFKMRCSNCSQSEVLASLSPKRIAEQLTWIDVELFRRIQPRDFLRHVWSRPQQRNYRSHIDGVASNPLMSSIEHFNFVSGWITSLIVNEPVLEKRADVFEHCLKVATELRRLNNFNTLMAVLAGVNSAAVLRLKQTRTMVQSRNKELYSDFRNLEALMSSERSFSQYRTALAQSVHPGMPYLGIHQQDLVSLGEANSDYTANGNVHWKKFRLVGDTIQDVMRFQYPTYTAVSPDFFVVYFIGHKRVLATEDDLYEKSMEIEPRSLKSSPSLNSTVSTRWLTGLK